MQHNLEAEVRKLVVRAGSSDNTKFHPEKLVREHIDLLTQHAAREQLGLINRLNREIFYTHADPPGQHVKDCLMAEHDRLASERDELARYRENS